MIQFWLGRCDEYGFAIVRVPALLSRFSSIQPVTLKPVTGGKISEFVRTDTAIGVLFRFDVARTAGFSASSKRTAGSKAIASFALVQLTAPAETPSRQKT